MRELGSMTPAEKVRARQPFALLPLAAAAIVLAGLAGPAAAQQTGRAVATGSDTLFLGNTTYRLFGIDSMELNQSCFLDGQPQACGASATRALQVLLDPAAVTCTPAGDAGAALVTCTGHDGDIAEAMVKEGWALALRDQTDKYVAAEDAARAAKVGIWRGTFLTPWDYRAQVAAIEADYARRAAASARIEAEAQLTGGDIGIEGLEGVVFRTGAAAAGSDEMVEREVRFADFAPGFVTTAIAPPDIFEWKRVAGVLETTREKGIATIRDSVRDAVWDGLKSHASRTTATTDAASYYAALRAGAEKWIAEGRKPVLFVKAQDAPNWIREWFAGKPPAGATVTSRKRISEGGYLGTIDGIDVYVGPVQDRASLLFPADLLSTVTFRTGEGGAALALSSDPDRGNEWVARYALSLRWLDDTVVWIEYPQASAPTPDFT